VNPRAFDPRAFDIALYQIGNNPDHAFAYEMALEHPGVAVIHEANLHHLVADLTIKRGDWDAYLAEAEYNGGADALAHARRVRKLEVGPDYEGVPMLRRLLERSRGLIVHSRYVECEMRKAGFAGQIARIPHGAWLPEPGDRMGHRARLGVDPATPLAGIFGHLKPYKRIPEALRAFRRVVRVLPDAKLILVGEPHPDLPLYPMLKALGLEDNVRVTGFTPIEEFVGYIAACDVVLNLRYPTVGESSGTLLRAFGLAKPVIVSDVGAFSEFPDEVCLKVPIGGSEEDLLFEYLNLLMSRPPVAKSLGERARAWVERECAWDVVAKRYVAFLEALVKGAEWTNEEPAHVELSSEEAAPAQEQPAEAVGETYLRTWAVSDASVKYMDTHQWRLTHTLEITPPGGPADHILEMGSYFQITPSLKLKLGYGHVRGCYYGPAGMVERKQITSLEGEHFECDIDLFDAEHDRFPYADEHYTTVLCCELIEHLPTDPMFMMAEINRILKTGGHLVLTTPNIASDRALAAILQGYHPGFFPAYIRPAKEGEEPEARHAREYTPREVARLFVDSGFEVERLETGPFRDDPKPELIWVQHLLAQYKLLEDLRGDGIYIVGRKTCPVRQRYPDWLYSGGY
jgi:glycosyltransferase involved in cell wall biosynthesis/SAM-dependent methyltransferase